MNTRLMATVAALGFAFIAFPHGAMAQEGLRTPWGDPSFNGIWTNSTTTPMQRPDDLAGKEFYSPEEAAEINREQAAGAPTSDTFFRDMVGIVPTLRTSLVIDPPDGKVPALTPEAQQLFDELKAYAEMHPFDGPENLDNTTRCIHFGGAGPPIIPEPYNNKYHIFQTRDYVAILAEMNHTVRVVPLTEREALPGHIRQWVGDSQGRWEGETLVVETTNLDTNRMSRYGVFLDTVADENLRITERFTRTGADTIMYQATMENPGIFVAPWTMEAPFRTDPGPLVEFACHEGNYGMTNILSGARADEAAAAAE